MIHFSSFHSLQHDTFYCYFCNIKYWKTELTIKSPISSTNSSFSLDMYIYQCLSFSRSSITQFAQLSWFVHLKAVADFVGFFLIKLYKNVPVITCKMYVKVLRNKLANSASYWIILERINRLENMWKNKTYIDMASDSPVSKSASSSYFYVNVTLNIFSSRIPQQGQWAT